MAKFKVKITQVFRSERSIIVEVEADSLFDAINKQSESDAPGFNEGWTEGVTELMNEEVEAAE